MAIDGPTTRRLVAVGALVCLGLMAGVYYGGQPPDPSLGAPPSSDELIANYGAYLDQAVVVTGAVTDTDPLTITATSQYGETIDLRLQHVGVQVMGGDYLSASGTVRPNNTIAATNTVKKPGSTYWRTRLLSLLAGLIVLGVALRHWQFDLQRFEVRPKDEPLRISTLHSGGDDG